MSARRISTLGLNLESFSKDIFISTAGLSLEESSSHRRVNTLGLMAEVIEPLGLARYITGLGLMVELTFGEENFTMGGTYNDAFTLIRDLLYEHTVYNTSIVFQAIPLYHLEANTIINLGSARDGLKGNFVVNTITIPLSYSETMNINATQAVEKL